MDRSHLLKQFAGLDTDGSGTLDASELMAQMPDGSRQKAETILDMMDFDGDGQVSYKEFVRFYFGGFEEDVAMTDADGNVVLEQLTDPDGDGVYEESSS